MASRVTAPTIRRSVRWTVALIAIIIVWVILRDPWPRAGRTENRPVSDAFRRYLTDPKARLVVYSPQLLHGDADDRRTVHRQLARLHERFDGIVLYQSDANASLILEEAASLGYSAALLTVWNPRSPQEIRAAADLVNRYRDQLSIAVSIGSEGLMEGRYSIQDVEQAGTILKSRCTGPQTVEVTTTEPWWLFTRHTDESRRLDEFGDLSSLNIHVIWDSDIADPSLAADWTADRALDVRRTVNKPVIIREGGLPGGGTSPRPGLRLEFTRHDQAEFWVAWLQRQRRDTGGIPPLVAFEALDNEAKDWKNFESSWGFLSPNLEPYPVWNVLPPQPVTVGGRHH